MKNALTDELLEIMAAKFQMMSEPSRLKILRALMEGEKNVTEVVRLTDLSQANVSKHLKLLLGSELIGRRKEGLMVYYRVVDPLVQSICAVACEHLGVVKKKR